MPKTGFDCIGFKPHCHVSKSFEAIKIEATQTFCCPIEEGREQKMAGDYDCS